MIRWRIFALLGVLAGAVALAFVPPRTTTSITQGGSGLDGGYIASTTPHTLAPVFIGAETVASTNYGGDALPAHAFTVTEAAFRTSVAGSGGTTDFALRISDGTNHCDCTMPCNADAGNQHLNCLGSDGGAGPCAFAASAELTYSVNSIGDCTTGPTVVGNAQVRGIWQ